MGYNSNVSGEITVTNTRKSHKLSFDVIEQKIHEDDNFYWFGSLEEKPDGSGFILGLEGEGKAYDIEENIQHVIDFFKKNGYTTEGVVHLIGEVFPDVSRVIVREGRAVHEKGEVTVTFPDGSRWGV